MSSSDELVGGLKWQEMPTQNPTNHIPSNPPVVPTLLSHTMAHQEDHTYHAQDTFSAAIKSTALTGSVGFFAAAVQNTLTKQNVGPMGIFVRGGGTIGIFGMNSFA